MSAPSGTPAAALALRGQTALENASLPRSQAFDLPPRPLPRAPPGWAIRFGLALRRALQALADAIVPAEAAVLETALSMGVGPMLGVVARHRIADLLLEGPQSAEALAAKTGLDADALHRVMRALAVRGFFTLDGQGRFGTTRLSRALETGRTHGAREFVEYFGSRSNALAWVHLEETVQSGRVAFDAVHGCTVWEWFGQHPHEEETFALAMMGLTTLDAPAVASQYPWGEVKRVCDVGGGRGTLLSELLLRHPHLKGLLLDSPGVVASAQRLAERRGVAERLERVGGSFFESVPPGADGYVLKNILHDWDDATSLRILERVRAAMAPGARLLVIEALTERNQGWGLGPASDVQMLVVCGGRERSLAEFDALFAKAGLVRRRVFPGALVSIIEATLQEAPTTRGG